MRRHGLLQAESAGRLVVEPVPEGAGPEGEWHWWVSMPSAYAIPRRSIATDVLDTSHDCDYASGMIAALVLLTFIAGAVYKARLYR